jgi:MFS family permease
MTTLNDRNNSIRRKLVVPTCFTLMFCQGYFMSSYQVALAAEADEFGLTATQIGILGGVVLGIECVIPVIFGILADRSGKKKPFLLFALMFLIAGILVFRGASIFTVLILGAMLCGSGYGTIEGMTAGVLADTYPEKTNMFVNWNEMMLAISMVIGPICSTAMMNSGTGWRFIYIPPLIAFVGCLVLLSFTDMRRENANDDTKKAVEVKAEDDGKKRGMSEVFKHPLFYFLMLWIGFAIGTENITASYSTLFFRDIINVGSYAGFANSAFWVAYIPARFVFGLRKNTNSTLPITLCMTAEVVALIVLTFAPNAAVAVACLMVMGFCNGPIFPGIFNQGVTSFPWASGTLGTIQCACGGMGAFVFTALCGVFADGVGTIKYVYLFAAGLFIIGIVISIYANSAGKKLRKQNEANQDVIA